MEMANTAVATTALRFSDCNRRAPTILSQQISKLYMDFDFLSGLTFAVRPLLTHPMHHGSRILTLQQRSQSGHGWNQSC